MRYGLRTAWMLVSAFAVAACATTASREVGAPYSMHDLRICPAMSVSNAPQTQGGGVIAGYSPLTVVHGVMLARAPVDACLSSAFGGRNGGAGSFHAGLDLYTGAPRPVLAGGDGRIASIREQRGYGLVADIDHRNGVMTRYAHLSSVSPEFRVGDRIAAGETFARTGKSGNATAIHLHYEILVDGRPQDPLTVGD